MIEQDIAETPMPIDHWSHSSLSLLLRNPLAFKKKYMLKIYDNVMSPSGVVGQACHKAVESYLNNGGVQNAIDVGMEHINSVGDISIDFGKTGSREKMLKDYTAGVNFYFEEMPDWNKRDIVMVEGRMTEVIHDESGNEMPLPAKCFVDVLWKSTKSEVFADRKYKKGSVFIEDHKFVRSFSDPTETDPTRLRQAFFNLLIAREKLGNEPAAVLFHETKLSKNKNGDPQSQYYVVDFDEMRQELPAFFQLYIDCTKYVMNEDTIYLPNPSDMFDGKDAWLSYRNNLITSEAPKIIHKTKEVKFTEKKYHESAPNKVENKNLTPEEKIRVKLQEFGIPVEMQDTHTNGSVIMYTLKPSRGVRMTTIEKHSKDIAIALEAKTIRIQAPIMGTDKVGIEIPNEQRAVVPFFTPDGSPDERTGMETGSMNIPVGLDVYGNVVKKDLRDMPHLLIAGSTGSGKSVMLNVILHSLTHQNSSQELNLVLIDPKRVELAAFADMPHVMSRVIHEHSEAIKALKWLGEEMEGRYKTLSEGKYRKIEDYNADRTDKMTTIVVVIDEFADLMLTKVKGEPSDAEIMIVRLAQKSRAVGIHLIIATQRPSVDVVTGLIKANLPTRIAFMTSSRTDSQIVIDQAGADELVGKGDMLFLDPSTRGLQRLQGFYA